MTLRKLEALSIEDLKNLLKGEDIDDIETMSREELIDTISELYGEDDSPVDSNAAKFVNTLVESQTQLESLKLPSIADIPDTYNETSIHAVLRDNCWVYVYWDIAGSVYNKLRENGIEEYSLVLRTIRLDPAGDAEDFYDIAVQTTDRDWNVTLPSAASVYKIQIVVVSGDYSKVLAESGIVNTPDPYWFRNAQELSRDTKASALLFAPVISKGKLVLNYPILRTLVAKASGKEN